MSNLRNRICALESAIAASTAATVGFLPTPRVRLARDNPIGLPTILEGGGGAGPALTWVTHPQVVAINVPTALLDPALDLRVELLRYKKAKSQSRPGWGTYVHPSHYMVGSNPNGSDTHGGQHTDTAGIPITINRPSEWSVTSRNQVIDLVDLAVWFSMLDVDYQDAVTLTNQQVTLPCPAGEGKTFGYYYGRRFMYVSRFRPNYFRFRYSILDLDEGRGRLTGPQTPTLAVSTDIFPFLVDDAVSAAQGRAFGTLDPRLVTTNMRCSWQTRLPR